MIEQWITPAGRHAYRGRPSDDKRARLVASGAILVDPLPAPIPTGETERWRLVASVWIDEPSQAMQAGTKADAREAAVDAIASRRVRITLGHNEALRDLIAWAVSKGMPLDAINQRSRQVIAALHDIAVNPDLQPGDEA